MSDTPRSRFGSIEVRRKDDKGRPDRWRPKYRSVLDGNTWQIGPTVRTRGQAEKWLADEERLLDDPANWTPVRDRRQADKVQAEQEAVTVGDMMRRWLELREASGVRASTLQTYRRQVENRVLNVGGDAARLRSLPAYQVTSDDVEAWSLACSRQFDTLRTDRAAAKHLKAAFAQAVQAGKMQANPVLVSTAAPRSSKAEETEPPATADLEAIVDAMPDRYRLIAALCLFHGVRIGEALALKRKHLVKDGDTYVIQVRGNLQRIGKPQRMELQPPKTKAGRRDIKLFHRLDAVAEHLEKFAPDDPEAFLTSTRTGKAAFDTLVRKCLDGARTKAGVTAHIAPHDGRRWLISYMLERGMSPKAVGRYVGDDDLSVILETYARVSPEYSSRMLAGFRAELSGKNYV